MKVEFKKRPADQLSFAVKEAVGNFEGHEVVKKEKGLTKVCLIDGVVKIKTISTKFQTDAIKYWKCRKIKFLVSSIFLFTSFIGIPFGIYCVIKTKQATAAGKEWKHDPVKECITARTNAKHATFEKLVHPTTSKKFISPEEKFNKFLEEVDDTIKIPASIKDFFHSHPLSSLEKAANLLHQTQYEDHGVVELQEYKKEYTTLLKEYEAFKKGQAQHLEPHIQKLKKIEQKIQEELEPYKKHRLQCIALAKQAEHNAIMIISNYYYSQPVYGTYLHKYQQIEHAQETCKFQIKLANNAYDLEEAKVFAKHKDKQKQALADLEDTKKLNKDNLKSHFEPKIADFLSDAPEISGFLFPENIA